MYVFQESIYEITINTISFSNCNQYPALIHCTYITVNEKIGNGQKIAQNSIGLVKKIVENSRSIIDNYSGG